MEGVVTAVSSSSVTINSSTTIGSGTFTSWTLSIAGEIGYTGSQGVIGYTGSRGLTGTTGAQGPIGYTGSRGATGFTGSQGVIGYTGSKGDTGSQGIQGPIGYTGSQGIQGVIGYTGSQGIQGVIGYTGSRGIQGIQGIQGFTGSKGDIGYTGSRGIQGIQGVIGYTGSRGFTGSKGDTGFNGSIGATGPQGPIGYTGSRGATGFTGSQGIQGPIGYTGSQGIQGIQGVIGYTGSRGLTGFTGSTGSQGPAGPSTTINATDDDATTTLYPVMVGGTGNQTAKITDGKLSFNASNGTLTVQNITVTGTQTIKDVQVISTSSGVIFDGSTADANKTTLNVENPTANRTVLLPNSSGTVLITNNAKTDGYFYLGSTPPSNTTRLNYDGNLHVTNLTAGTITETSSRDIKENIRSVEDNIVGKLLQLNPVIYDRIDGTSNNEIGLIAEDVEKIIPELVSYDENGKVYGVKYQKLAVLLLQGFKILYNDIQDLKKDKQ
jgi:hypothetical protein